jgi:diguanylate cyclase (GGDEF)-like protein
MKTSLALLGQRYEAVFKIMLVTSLLAYAGYLLLFLALGIPFLPIANASAIAATSLALRLLSREHLYWALGVMGATVLAHAFFATSLLGWDANFHLFGFVVLIFLLVCPYFSLTLRLMIFCGLTGAYGLLEMFLHGPRADLPPIVLLLRSLNTVVFCAILAFLAHTYAVAMGRATQELEALNADLTRLATIDGLTGLFNRRYLSEQIHTEIERFNRSGRTFAVVLGDIDDFKAINDQHGHQGGDAVLAAVSQLLCEAVRTQDQVARWGGEEFLAFLPETTATEAAAVTERIQHQFAKQPLLYGNAKVPVRMTFGIAQFTPGQTLDDLLACADRALYRGKSAGKNRIVLAA